MSMTRQEQLDAVVRNYGEWDKDYQFAYIDMHGEIVFTNAIVKSPQVSAFTRDEVEQRKAELQNKPSNWNKRFNLLVQDSDGDWFFGSYKECEPSNDGWRGVGEGIWTHAGRGEVIGDWRDTLEKRPLADDQPTPEEEESFKMLEARNGECIDSSGGEVMSQSNSELYPQYFKDVSGLDEIDVYAVHQLFAVDDPSGAIQHASKKLLLSGVRTGGKGKYKDIKEARDTLNRWLELNNE